MPMENFSTYTRLIRCTAYIFRFVNAVKRKSTDTLHLSSTELQHALSYWIQFTQQIEFAYEIKTISNYQPLHSNSKLLSLNPILDKEGVLRVGGRLQHSSQLRN